MSRYAIRVELRGSPAAHVYEQLHAVLARNGAHRTIVSDAGTTHFLPNGMYVGNSNQNAQAVIDALTPVVKTVWTACDLAVFRYDQSAWTPRPASPRHRAA